MKEPEERQCVTKGVVHRAHTTETQVEDRAAGGHGSLVASARAGLEEEKGRLHMSYFSQKPDCNTAKGEGWKVEEAHGSQVCFIFTASKGEHLSIRREGASGAGGQGWSVAPAEDEVRNTHGRLTLGKAQEFGTSGLPVSGTTPKGWCPESHN